MADDQATLGEFDREDADGADSEGSDGEGDAGETAAPEEHTEEQAERTDGTTDLPSDDLVCPWCLAPGDRFVEAGPTGLACGRCAAALPVDADWFRAREVVARRPMYEVE